MRSELVVSKWETINTESIQISSCKIGRKGDWCAGGRRSLSRLRRSDYSGERFGRREKMESEIQVQGPALEKRRGDEEKEVKEAELDDL